ncbi:hypothetical protein [Nostoc sp. DedQUE09]|uniref:hypothetical protein n=1 Tax=Nostoc sp. DedQUE09 TaxID=3075394 RepID=UPI002AD2F92A|nr:hypothetical protein [Nostoc sp. DedQUE09]MDZ7952238.1 hypothetical protein [Nostoc sp. DedQUE09]
MKYDNLWEGTRSSYWLPAFSLPLLHWVKPFLPFLGLPDFILKQPLIWEQIYTQAALEYQTARETQDLSGKYYDQVIKQVVTKALQNLAAVAGRDVARDFERWVIAHFCCHELEIVLRRWQLLLAIACEPPGSRRDQVPPPAVLVPILPEIADFIGFDCPFNIHSEVRTVAPPPEYEQIPYERLGTCYEATMLIGAIQIALTIKALKAIASQLNAKERQKVVQWAQLQHKALNPSGYNRKELGGDKYLRVEPPCQDAPSVIDDQLPAQIYAPKKNTDLASHWQNYGDTWLKVLSLPTLPWVQPFIELMGVPKPILDQPEVWQRIYTNALNEYKQRRQEVEKQGELQREIVTKALKQLAAEMGRYVASDFERWVWVYFLNHKFGSMLRRWEVILGYAAFPKEEMLSQAPFCLASGWSHNKFPPPVALVPILPDIKELVSNRGELIQQIEGNAPPPIPEEDSYVRLGICYEATLILWAVNRELTIKALQAIASRLNEQERKEVIAWAKVEDKATWGKEYYWATIDLYQTDLDKFCFDIPSLLDILLEN